MYLRLKSIALMSVTAIFSLSLPVYADSTRLLTQNPSSLAQNSTADVDKLFEQGVKLYRRGQDSQALEVYQRVLKIRRQQQDKAGIAETLNNLGRVYISLLEKDKADKALQEALVIRRELKDRKGEGETLENIGRVYGFKGEYKKALELLEQALSIRREVKDRKGEAETLKMIGVVYSFGFDNNAKALEFLQQALNIQQEVKDKYQASWTLFNIGRTYYFLNDYPRALEFLEKAKVLSREAENPVAEVLALKQIASVYSQKGNFKPAAEAGEEALVLARKNQFRGDELDILNSLANTYLLNKKPARARDLAQEAVNLARELKKRNDEAKALNSLGSAYITLRDYQKAETVSLQALSIAKEIENLDIESYALSSLNTIYFQRGEFNKQIDNQLRILEIARKQKDEWDEFNALKNLATTYNTLGKNQQALEAYQQSLAILRQIEITKLSPLQQKMARIHEVFILQGISLNYRGLGEYKKALDFAQQTLKKAQSINQPEYEIQALLYLAHVYDIPFNNLLKAIELSQQALNIAKQIKKPEKEAKALLQLSHLYNKQGKYTDSVEYAQKALTTAKKLNNPSLEYSALSMFTDIYQKQGKYQKALEFAQQAYAVTEKENLGNYKQLALTNLSNIYYFVGDTVKAEETAKKIIKLAQENGYFSNELSGLLHLLRVYQVQGKYEEGIETGQTALQKSRQSKHFFGELAASIGLIEMYERLGNHQKVIAVAQPYLSDARKRNQRDKEAELLINLGNAYRVIGEYSKGKELIEQGLKIARELKNPRLELNALNNLGYYYSSVKDYQKALELTQQSLKIAQKLKSPPLLISPQFNLGEIYSSLGDYQKSRDYYQQALTTSQKLKNRRSEGVALLFLADTHFSQGNPQKTIELSQQALSIFQEIKVPQLQAFAHGMLSLGYGNSMNDSKAIENAQKFLQFARKVENPVFEKKALNILGMIHYRFGRISEASKAYQQALAIQTPENVTGNNSGIYAGLGRVYRKLNQPNIAIGYYKQAINGIENIRRGIEGLPPELQNSFLDTVVDFKGTKTADIYRELAELLISQGRQPEARQVLDLLKIQEIRDFAEGTTDTIKQSQLPQTDEDKKIQTTNESIIALSRQISECDRTECKERSKLNDKLTAVLKKFNQQLKTIDKEIEASLGKDKATLHPNELGEAADILKAQPDTVMIYPFVLEDKLWLLLYSGKAAKKFEVKVSRSELGNTVKQFRDLMKECEIRGCGAEEIAKIKPVSQKLYSWLIKPIDKELQENKVKNLVFSLDRVTRYIPMSALYDGKQYLVENYTVYNVFSAGLTNTSARLPAKIQDTKILAMGVSKAVGGFPALNNVSTEVDNIVKNSKDDKGVYPGKEYLNQSFNYKTLRDNLIGKNILHLATHGEFVRDRKDASYLLLGNGEKLPITDIQTLADLGDIHLVVLSACQTALAAPNQDGVEIASLAYSFLHRKVKSVMASLWQVNDSSTSTLMQNFYKNLANNKQKITKAEAMRLAQLQLLYNKDVTVDDIKRSGDFKFDPISSLADEKSEAKSFAHPYYWAPFVLIGNGL